jgi:hypothetical protein
MTIAVIVDRALPELRMVLSVASTVMLAMFSYTSTEVFGWFEYAKGFYVVVYVLLYNFCHVDPSVASNTMKLILSICIMVNVAEVSLYEVLKPQRRRKINGMLLFVLAATTPLQMVFSKQSGSLGFEDNLLWQVNYTLLLTDWSLFSGSLENIRFPNLFSLVVHIIMSIYYGNHTNWMLYRPQTLYMICFVDILFNRFHDNVHIETSEIIKSIGSLELPLLSISAFTTVLMVMNKIVIYRQIGR